MEHDDKCGKDCTYCDKCAKSEELSRRNFLTKSTIAMGVTIGGILGWNIITYFISPIWETIKGTWVRVASLDDLPDGTPTLRTYIVRKMDGWIKTEDPKDVWLLREGNQVTAFDPHCTHLGCGYNWDAESNQFKCPCHNGVFDKHGNVVSGPPPWPLDKYPVSVKGNAVNIIPIDPKREEAKS